MQPLKYIPGSKSCKSIWAMGPNSLSRLLGSLPKVNQPLFTHRPKKYFMVRRLQWLLLLLYVPDREDGLLSSVACIVSAGDDCHGGHDSSRLSCCQLPKISSTEQALMLFMIIFFPSFSITIYMNCVNHLRQEKHIQSSGPCLD